MRPSGVGTAVGVDEVLAERSPAEKVDAARLERAAGPTIMVQPHQVKGSSPGIVIRRPLILRGRRRT